MFKKTFTVLWFIVLTITIIAIPFDITCFADGIKPIPVEFRKSGGGQFIYCNNPEWVRNKDLSTKENPNPTYLMKNEGLKPDNYSVFFCFSNWTDYDLEPDIEFISKNNATIKINSIGFYIPQGYEYVDCIDVWADLLGINIRTLNNYQQYVPYKGKTELPKTINLDNSSDWISKYVYNYDVLKQRMTFNMLVDFTIESGEADVNFTAQKHYGKIGDRTMHSPNAASGQYYNDTSVKGIDTETLPMVEADLDIHIDSSVQNGDSLQCRIFNQFYNDGNNVPHWMTNINPANDAYMFSKGSAVGSDMLNLKYKDDTKLNYYGKDVPEPQRDNIWNIDIYHHATTGYKTGMPWNENTYVPNAPSGNTLDINHLPDTQYEFNLGNFGVTNRYHLTIKNSDTLERVLNYTLETSLSSNIVIARDEDGNMLNPYTLEEENAFALCKGINDTAKEDCMFSAAVDPGETKKYILDVILPTNCYGGMVNRLKVDDHKYLMEQTGTPFPDYTETYEYKSVFYNGQRNMKWEDGKLYQYTDDGNWELVPLPDSTKKIFESRTNEFRMIKTSDGYAARFDGWDGYGGNVAEKETENKVYFFDAALNYISSKEFPDYIYDFAYADNTLYVYSDKYYSSSDCRTFTLLGSGLSFPVTNGHYSLFRKTNEFYLKNTNGDTKISYENGTPGEILSDGGLFYYTKSWKAYYTDTSTSNILSVSPDGIYWTDIPMPDKFLEIKNVSHIGNKIYVDCKFEVYTFDDSILNNSNIKVNLNNEILAFGVAPEMVNNRTMVPLRFIFEKLNAKVSWNGETDEVIVEKDSDTIIFRIGSNTAMVNGKETALDVPPYIENSRTLIPVRFLAENLGYNVTWDNDTRTAVILKVN